MNKNRFRMPVKILAVVLTLMFGGYSFNARCEDPDGYALTTDDLDWIDGFGYVLYGKEAFLWKAPMNQLRVEIPAKVTKNGKTYKVKQICPCVFMEWDAVNGVPTNPMIREIVLPNTITKIGSYAFENQKRLTSVNIPESVREIEHGAFGKCKSLERIVLPDSLEKISDGLFSSCENLRFLYIPANVKEIEQYAFAGCKSLESITLPEGITKIDIWTFSNCKSLKSIVIPSTVKRICKWVFWGCDNLESVIFLNPDTMIHPEAFKDEAVVDLVNWNGRLDYHTEDEGYYLVHGEEMVFYHSNAAKFFGSEEEAEKHYVREYVGRRKAED